MKLLTLVLLSFSLHALGFSRDYSCNARMYRLDITLGDSSTSLWVWDKFARQYLYNGYASDSEVLGNFKTYYFYPTMGSRSKMTFNNEELATLPDRLFGFIDGNFGVMIYDDFECRARD